MNTSHRLLIIGVLGAGLATSILTAAEGHSAVALPTKRHEMLESAKSLLATQPVSLPTDLANPFNPPAFAVVTGTARSAATTGSAGTGESPAAKPSGPRTERDILREIATGLKPSGFFVLGGEPTLVFGQKRVKAGGHLTITFEGAEYTLEITAIDRPNFTLRLNREEFTRPIK
jgi:hypothetical protein